MRYELRAGIVEIARIMRSQRRTMHSMSLKGSQWLASPSCADRWRSAVKQFGKPFKFAGPWNNESIHWPQSLGVGDMPAWAMRYAGSVT